MTLHDSGERREFDSGAVRDMQEGKGRCDLLPAAALLRLAKHYEAGAAKYEDRNWEKGIPISVFVDSAMRHLLKYMDGQTDEDHLVAVAWNIMGAMWTEEKKPELQDLPSRSKNDISEIEQYAINDVLVTAELMDKVSHLNKTTYIFGTEQERLDFLNWVLTTINDAGVITIAAMKEHIGGRYSYSDYTEGWDDINDIFWRTEESDDGSFRLIFSDIKPIATLYGGDGEEVEVWGDVND